MSPEGVGHRYEILGYPDIGPFQEYHVSERCDLRDPVTYSDIMTNTLILGWWVGARITLVFQVF